MEREILFKGKRKDNGKWIEGYYQKRYDFFEDVQHLIFWDKSSTVWEYAEVDPETVCQYTGLTDKNGRKIFEVYIIQFEETGEEGYEYKEAFDFTNKAKVVWNKGRFELDSFWSDNSGVMESMNDCPDEFYDMFEYYSEVISNIFDNPELIGE